MKKYFVFLSIAALSCKTGSNYENLQQLRRHPEKTVEAPAISGTYYIRPFVFVERTNRSEMFRKAFVVPGYKGIDFDGYGRMAASDENAGMRTFSSQPDVHIAVGEEIGRLGAKVFVATDAPPDGAQVIEVKVLNSESSMRMHTYGCWPFVGFFVYLVNGDVYTTIVHTQAEFRLTGGGKTKSGRLDVYTAKDFGFWTTYAGMEILESFSETQQAHVKDFALALGKELLPL